MTPDEQRAFERLQRTVDKVTAERDAWIANYMTVADAVAAESNSPQQLASITRSARAELARLRDENARLAAERDEARAQLQCQPRESIAEVVKRTIDGSAMLTSELARVTADRDAAIAARDEMERRLVYYRGWDERMSELAAIENAAWALMKLHDDPDAAKREALKATLWNELRAALASSRDGKEGA